MRGVDFLLRGAGDSELRVEARSWFFDTYLVLRDAEGRVLAEDDDGGLATHSTIRGIRLPEGEVAVVTVCALNGSAGPFEVRLEAGPPPALPPEERDRAAVAELEEAVRRVIAARGEEHPDATLRMDHLATELARQGHLEEALPIYERALRLTARRDGEGSPEAAAREANLAAALARMGRHGEAALRLRRVLEVYLACFGERHAETASVLNNLGYVLDRAGHAAEARAFYRRALSVRTERLGEDHPLTASTLNNLGALERALGNLDQARTLYERALGIVVRRLGEDHPGTAAIRNNLAEVLLEEGRPSEARAELEHALRILSASLGEEHSRTVGVVNNLAVLLQTAGRYEEARGLYERALAVREARLGADHPETAGILNSLATLLEVQGRFEDARPLYERALAIRTKALGPDHPDTARVAWNLAGLLDSLGRDEEARLLLLRALSTRERALGPEHPDTGRSLARLALVSAREGRADEAMSLLLRALSIFEKTLGPDHPVTVRASLTRAEFLASEGKGKEALAPALAACGRLDAIFGPEHPETAAAFETVARIQADLGDARAARETAARALALTDARVDRALGTLTEAERLRYARLAREALDLELGLEAAAGGAGAARAAWAAVLSWKGRVSRSLLGGAPGGTARLRALQARLSDELYRRDIGDPAAHRQRLADLRAERTEAERELLALRPAAAAPEGGADAVGAGLPAGGAAVDFFVHRVYRASERGGSWSAPRVSAFVLRAGEPGPAWVDLGDAGAIGSAVDGYLAELVRSRGLREEDGAAREANGRGPSPAAVRLRELLWDPLADRVGDAGLVVVSPDGIIATLPFETIRGADGSYLVERHAFAYLSSLRDLPEGEGARPEGEDPSLVVAGAVDYRGGSGKSGEAGAAGGIRGGFRPVWTPLSATREEVDAVEEIHSIVFPDARRVRLIGAEASEERVRAELPGVRYVHLATHGFFQPEWLPSLWKRGPGGDRRFGDADFGDERRVTGLWPGFLSGLVFAGANAEPAAGRDNGLLTAEEVGWLDLSRADLVVLSACETGLGRAEAGEGLLGLRRAFRQAGARTVVSSLWSVKDEATRDLMAGFYSNLWEKGMGRLEALRCAELEILERNRKEFGDGLPASWGAFVLDGDWR